MKNYFTFKGLSFAGIAVVALVSCKKDSIPNTGSSLKEEFQSVYTLTQRGWIIEDHTASSNYSTAPWTQGTAGNDKGGTWYGFAAYSFKSTPDEYAYSSISYLDSSVTISSWLITPILSIKNGDKLSFYTRGDSTDVYTDRMQVLINHSTSANAGETASSVGEFTTVLFDINASQTPAGYPQSWTRYEYTFTGYAEKSDRRIAFRHFVDKPINARGVGLDLFQFQSK